MQWPLQWLLTLKTDQPIATTCASTQGKEK
jgi:hypothetical protein